MSSNILEFTVFIIVKIPNLNEFSNFIPDIVNKLETAKSEIIKNIQKNGTIILNRDDKFFNYLEKKAKIKNLKVLTFGENKNSDICLKKVITKKNNKVLTIKIFNQTLLFF